MTQPTRPLPEVSPLLLEVLMCPVSRTPLIYRPEQQELISPKARLAFPIRDGIPLLLVDEARELNEDEQA